MPEMHSWEFLIQQDGDRAWLPLDTSDVEILEGRYRIAAKSAHKNTPVEVRVRYDAIEEIPPKRRTQLRTTQTNQNGLMVVVPFTQLQPGVWEFNCTSTAGEQHSVQLRVLPPEPELVEDWSFDWEDGDPAPVEFVAPRFATDLSEANPVAADTIAANPTCVDEILHQAEAESDTMADEILQEYGLVLEAPSEDFNPPQSSLPLSSTVLIELPQTTLITSHDEPLTLSGQITSEDLTELEAELRICLRDPQTSQPLLEACETLHHDLPFELIYRLTLPAELRTQLILGEITLHDVNREGHPIVASQSFTLMSDVNELLDAMHDAEKDDRANAEEMLDLPSTSPIAPPSPLNLAFLNFVAAPKDSEGANFTIKETSSLPPQLRPSSPYVRRKLDLPTFSSQLDSAPADDTTEATQLELPLSGASVPLEVELTESLDSDDQSLCLTPLKDAQPASEFKIQAADQDNLLAADPPGDEVDQSDLEANANQGINEFVVDDEPILPLADLIISRRQNLAASDRAQNPLLLPDTEPVPDPMVLIADSDLTVGKSTLVRIKLPDILPKIYVKLWLSDRQSRTLITPPRWVIDFNPDGHGNLEATTEITAPFDSVEVQIEAVAVEVMTNRESHKVVIDRRVIAEVPNAWSDDLDRDSASS